MMIKALVFDFDGLILDTETPSYHAFRQIYEEYGIDLSLETYSQCIGTSYSAFNPYTYLAEQTGQAINHDETRARFRQIYEALLEREQLRPGVMEYLEAGARLGLQIGIASSSSITWIKPHLERFGISKYFSSITTSDVVQNVKPDPELYLLALQSLNVTGPEAISFEDSLNGLKAARAAGLNCVVVPNEVTSHLAFADHDLMIASMKELPLEQLIGRLHSK